MELSPFQCSFLRAVAFECQVLAAGAWMPCEIKADGHPVSFIRAGVDAAPETVGTPTQDGVRRLLTAAELQVSQDLPVEVREEELLLAGQEAAELEAIGLLSVAPMLLICLDPAGFEWVAEMPARRLTPVGREVLALLREQEGSGWWGWWPPSAG